MGLTTAVGVLQGTSSPMFAMSLVFALIVSGVPEPAAQHAGERCTLRRASRLHVPHPAARLPTSPRTPQVMYDASGVRLHAGKQASVLNQIITELPPDHPVSNSAGTLKDTLGHTPLQVAVGAVVGVLTGYLTALLYL